MLHVLLEFSAMPSSEGSDFVVHLTLQLDIPTCGMVQPLELLSEPELVRSVRDQINDKTFSLELCEQGTGGTYFVKDSKNSRIAVFKPIDEEPGAMNNPKSLIDNPILAPGGGAVREVLAYLMDIDHKAGVPETFYLHDFVHPKWPGAGKPATKSGSLQKFVSHHAAAADMGSSLFSVEDVHNIGVFDIRLHNLDRNGENLLVVMEGNTHRLVPIDHSYILPPSFARKPFFEWLYYKQAKVPFSAETLKYIAKLDVDRDTHLLTSYGISPESIRMMQTSTLLLQKGAAAGLNLFQIASLICADDDSKKSELQSIVESAELAANNDEAVFFRVFKQLLDSLVAANCK